MIPVRLEMKNFLPYRAPDPVRFEGVHLACLTGMNGAGKSSLLDAITWALWGKARTKRDDDLIHLGQGDMFVQLDFEQEGAYYRVLRRRTRGNRRSGQGTLDLFIFREDESPNIISEPSMRATQEKINAILRLDYDTFVHSAFLQQGKADAFTTKNPSERKKILSDILGLEQWSKYEDAVKERLKDISNNLTYFAQRIAEIEFELARKPTLQKEAADTEVRYKEAELARQTAEEHLKAVEHAPTELKNTQANKAAYERRLREYERDKTEVETQLARQKQQIADYQIIIDNRAEIETGYQALQSARQANQTLSDKLLQLKSIDDERYTLQSQLDNARSRLESEIRNATQRISELEAITETDYSADLESLQAEMVQLQEREVERDQMNEEVNAMREQVAGLEVTLKSITAEGLALRERLEQLQATDDSVAMCPLCGQPLGVEERQNLIEQLQTEIDEKRDRYRENNETKTTLATQIKDQRALIQQVEGDLKRLSPMIERVGVLQTQMQAAQQATERLKEERATLAQVQAELEADNYAPDVRKQLAILAAKQTELGYDSSTHDDARQQLQAHNEYDQLHTRLTIALESLPTVQQSIEDAQARIERLKNTIHEAQNDITELDQEIIRLGTMVEEYRVREAEVQEQRTLERSAYERLVSAKQALDALDAQAARKTDLEQKRDIARQEEAMYNDLKQAFGKNGIPAMIIETAIPELEITANTLLSRMTDGRMHLRMTTQREKVTGGVMETLDIEIADELGTRNYELYSGGEAFRINFAIRVALSQMLARRAGAHLRTLFIDEGFGTQDEDGRTKLVEAINAIQSEFDLILVITHIDELRDNFPVHIVVDKTPSGSRIWMQ